MPHPLGSPHIVFDLNKLPDEDDLGRGGISTTLAGYDTVVHFKGVGIDWKVPLRLIKSLKVKVIGKFDAQTL